MALSTRETSLCWETVTKLELRKKWPRNRSHWKKCEGTSQKTSITRLRSKPEQRKRDEAANTRIRNKTVQARMLSGRRNEIQTKEKTAINKRRSFMSSRWQRAAEESSRHKKKEDWMMRDWNNTLWGGSKWKTSMHLCIAGGKKTQASKDTSTRIHQEL